MPSPIPPDYINTGGKLGGEGSLGVADGEIKGVDLDEPDPAVPHPVILRSQTDVGLGLGLGIQRSPIPYFCVHRPMWVCEGAHNGGGRVHSTLHTRQQGHTPHPRC